MAVPLIHHSYQKLPCETATKGTEKQSERQFNPTASFTVFNCSSYAINRSRYIQKVYRKSSLLYTNFGGAERTSASEIQRARLIQTSKETSEIQSARLIQTSKEK
jgi:hypothetical protein